MSHRDAIVNVAEQNAEYFTHFFLKPEYQPPLGSEFTLIPRLGGDDADMLRLSYRVKDKIITISQVRYMLLCQIDLSDKHSTSLMSVDDVEALGKTIFQNTQIEDGFSSRNPIDGSRVRLTDPKGNRLSWWQEPSRVWFYFAKNDGRLRGSLPSLDLAANGRWFTVRTKEESDYRYWIRSDDMKLILNQLVESHTEPTSDASKHTALLWSQRYLTSAYQAPNGLTYSELPSYRVGKVAAVEISYQVVDKVVTITHTNKLVIVQVEDVGFDEKSPLSDTATEAVAKQLFLNADGLTILTNNASATMAEGFAKVAADSKAPWLSRLHWWQDSGRVIFYLPQDASK